MTRQAFCAHLGANGRPGNRLLAGLPDADYRRLVSDLRTSSVRLNQVIQYGGEPIQHVAHGDYSRQIGGKGYN